MSQDRGVGPQGRLGFSEISEGTSLPECRIRMDPERYGAYNRLVDEINPLHFDRDFARALGFEDIVVAGIYSFSFIPRMIESVLEESARIRSIEIVYKSPLYVGEEIVQRALVKRKVEAEGTRWVELEVSVRDRRGRTTTEASVIVEFQPPACRGGMRF